MINITDSGAGLLVSFNNHPGFDNEATNTYPYNSLMISVDESNMITFRDITTNKARFSALFGDITAEGTTLTKDNFEETLAFMFSKSSGGGGGVETWTQLRNKPFNTVGETLTTEENILEVKNPLTDEEKAKLANVPNNLETELETKQEVFQVNSPMSFERDETTQDLHLSIDLSSKANQSDLEALQTTVAGKANQSDLTTLSQEVQMKADKTDVYTIQEVDTKLDDKANVSTVEDLSGEVAINSTDIATLKTTTGEQGEKINELDNEIVTKQDKVVTWEHEEITTDSIKAQEFVTNAKIGDLIHFINYHPGYGSIEAISENRDVFSISNLPIVSNQSAFFYILTDGLMLEGQYPYHGEWSVLSNKPFETVGDGLYVENGVLKVGSPGEMTNLQDYIKALEARIEALEAK